MVLSQVFSMTLFNIYFHIFFEQNWERTETFHLVMEKRYTSTHTLEMSLVKETPGSVSVKTDLIQPINGFTFKQDFGPTAGIVGNGSKRVFTMTASYLPQAVTIHLDFTVRQVIEKMM